MSMHCGTRRFGKGGVSRLNYAGLMGSDLQFVHLTATSPKEFRRISRAGAQVVIPSISELSMGIGEPSLLTLANNGSPFGFGVDSVVGSPPDMCAQMRSAMVILRGGSWKGPWENSTPPPGSRSRRSCRCHHSRRPRVLAGRRDTISHAGKGRGPRGHAPPTRPVTTVEQAFGQVVWMGEASRLESVLVDGQEMLARPAYHA